MNRFEMVATKNGPNKTYSIVRYIKTQHTEYDGLGISEEYKGR